MFVFIISPFTANEGLEGSKHLYQSLIRIYDVMTHIDSKNDQECYCQRKENEGIFLFSEFISSFCYRGWGGERRLNQIHRDGDVSPSVDVHIFRLCRCINFY